MAERHHPHSLSDESTPRQACRTWENDSAARCPSALPIDIVNFDALSINDSTELATRPAGAPAPLPSLPTNSGDFFIPNKGADSSIIVKRRRECPFHRLPTELLCVIFMMCGEIDDLSVHPRDPYMDPVLLCSEPVRYCWTAILLGYVCSRWLTVTRGCPQLWTTVDLPFPQRRDVTILELCLRYSAGLPMTLHLNDNKEYPLERRNVDICRRFMRIVASAAHRWVGIHVYIGRKEPKVSLLFEPLYSLPTMSYSSLKHVTLRPTHQFLDNDGRQATLRLWNVFYTSSALRTVRWHNVFIDVLAHAHTLRQLTHVGVNSIRSLDVMELFRACPRLEVFQGTVVTPSGSFPGKADGYLIPTLATPIALPHLRILMLRGMRDWSNLFDGLAAPLLNRLELSTTDIQVHAIERMLKRSEAKLAMLTLRHISCENVEQIKALLRCPALQWLKIFVYQPSEGSSESEDRWYFNPKCFVPANVVLCTKMYEHADTFYRSAILYPT